MKIHLTDTLTRTKKEFVPLKPNSVTYYSCGPTVYDYVHIGNLRTYIFTDILKRVLIYAGHEVKHVTNITDVGHLTSDADSGEDKMLAGARREKKTVWEIAAFYIKAFQDDIHDLNIIDPTIWCRATDHISEQIELIQKLENKGFAYVAGGNVYFDTSKFSDYGRLIGSDSSVEQKARVEKDPNKRNSHDFVLWFTKSKFQDQDMKWPSPWGVGYPGWHIECSAMSTHYLGQPFDIHSGGIDHIPVHHTNEIAQSEAAADGTQMARFWLHGEFLVIDKNKMAKSEGSFITLQALQGRGYDPLSYRYFCLQTHYRQQLNFTWEALTAAQNGYHGLLEDLRRMRHRAHTQSSSKSIAGEIAVIKQQIDIAFADDLNIPKALGFLHLLVSKFDMGQRPSPEDLDEILKLIFTFDGVFGLKLEERSQSEPIPSEIEDQVMERERARQDKNWSKSDDLRKAIMERGYTIEDTPQGPYVRKQP